MLSRGDKISGYEVIAPLRAGGMAMLYLARRRGVGGFSRLVALKLVHSQLAENARINRLFLQEARIAASIAHPNVVNVEEVGKVNGGYFMAMEYVHGISLAELLAGLQKRRLRMSAKLCVWVATHIAEALHAAHAARDESGAPLQIVHRDVSPQNVLISHTGHVKLIDFGIAKSHQPSRHASGGGSLLGKLAYMAPEQMRFGPVDTRTDVYALGVLLWEMLASRRLFRGMLDDRGPDWAIRKHPPPPSRYSPAGNSVLDRVVEKAIAFEAAGRYGSALEFRTALLQAEPAAAEVDAPRFGALMRRLFGEDLERRRAAWPREVNLELDLDAQQTTATGVNIDELTTRLWSPDLHTPTDNSCDEPPTAKESPRSRGPDLIRLKTNILFEPPAPSPSCATPTPTPRLGLPALQPAAAAGRAPAPRRRARSVALVALCLISGSSLGITQPRHKLVVEPATRATATTSASPELPPRAALAERANPIGEPLRPDEQPAAGTLDAPRSAAAEPSDAPASSSMVFPPGSADELAPAPAACSEGECEDTPDEEPSAPRAPGAAEETGTRTEP